MHSLLFFSGGKDSVATYEILRMQGIDTTLIHYKESSIHKSVSHMHELIAQWLTQVYPEIKILDGVHKNYCQMLEPLITEDLAAPVVLSNGEADQWPEIAEFAQIYHEFLGKQIQGIYNPWLWMDKNQLFHMWDQLKIQVYVYKVILAAQVEPRIQHMAARLLGTCVTAQQLYQIYQTEPQVFYSLQTLVVRSVHVPEHLAGDHIVQPLNQMLVRSEAFILV